LVAGLRDAAKEAFALRQRAVARFTRSGATGATDAARVPHSS
jgi:hypothetical protein